MLAVKFPVIVGVVNQSVGSVRLVVLGALASVIGWKLSIVVLTSESELDVRYEGAM